MPTTHCDFFARAHGRGALRAGGPAARPAWHVRHAPRRRRRQLVGVQGASRLPTGRRPAAHQLERLRPQRPANCQAVSRRGQSASRPGTGRLAVNGPGRQCQRAALSLAALLATAAANSSYAHQIWLTRDGTAAVLGSNGRPSDWEEITFEFRGSPADAFTHTASGLAAAQAARAGQRPALAGRSAASAGSVCRASHCTGRDSVAGRGRRQPVRGRQSASGGRGDRSGQGGLCGRRGGASLPGGPGEASAELA